MRGFIDVVRKKPAEVYGLCVAVVTLAAVYVDVPVGPVLGVAAALIAVVAGRAVQRVEDAKTDAALWSLPPDDIEASD